jgi:hypothetical protein
MRFWMKLVLSVIFLFIVSCASVPLTEEDRTIEKVFDAPGYSKDQVFDATKIWVAENFRSAKAVLEYENKDAGTIIGNGSIPYPCKGLECIGASDWKVPFTMRVDVKDQKFRLTFTNVHLSWTAQPGVRTAYDGPPARKGAIDNIRPVLLGFGDQLLTSFAKDKGKSNW